jgi:hypothetical protein
MIVNPVLKRILNKGAAFDEFEQHVRRFGPPVCSTGEASMAQELEADSRRVMGLIKKHTLHGEPLSCDELALGRLLWFWVGLCHQLGVDPCAVMNERAEEVRAAHPEDLDGFETVRVEENNE